MWYGSGVGLGGTHYEITFENKEVLLHLTTNKPQQKLLELTFSNTNGFLCEWIYSNISNQSLIFSKKFLFIYLSVINKKKIVFHRFELVKAKNKTKNKMSLWVSEWTWPWWKKIIRVFFFCFIFSYISQSVKNKINFLLFSDCH